MRWNNALKSKVILHRTFSNDENVKLSLLTFVVGQRRSAGMAIRGLEELSPNSLCFMVGHGGPNTNTNTNTNT